MTVLSKVLFIVVFLSVVYTICKYIIDTYRGNKVYKLVYIAIEAILLYEEENGYNTEISLHSIRDNVNIDRLKYKDITIDKVFKSNYDYYTLIPYLARIVVKDD